MFLLRAARDALWSFPMIALLTVSGGYFTIRTRLFQLHPVRICRRSVGTLFASGNSRRAMLASVATALGGTVGVGSITGVALGLAVGGAGSVFWMWVSGFTGMALKYAEVYIAVRHRERDANGGFTGGAPYALRAIGYERLGKLFALLCVLASFGVGNLAQIGALAEVTGEVGLSPLLCGLACALLLAVAVFGGRERIGAVNAFLVPTASVLFLGAMLWTVVTHTSALPGVFARIFREAFGLRACAGGVSGSLLALSMREGFARGVFSNEAGVGSSPLAHASSGEADPEKQGMWGAFEILMDTFLVSTLTAAALLCTGCERVGELFSSVFGGWGLWLFVLLMAVFAFASILSWCYYSEVCLAFLRLPRGVWLYRGATVVFAFIGAVVSMQAVWLAADVLNACMILPNLFLLFLLRREVLPPNA